MIVHGRQYALFCDGRRKGIMPVHLVLLLTAGSKICFRPEVPSYPGLGLVCMWKDTAHKQSWEIF